MKSQNINYSNYDKNLKKEEEILDSIFRKLTKNREEKNSLKKLEQLIKFLTIHIRKCPNSLSNIPPRVYVRFESCISLFFS